jgi:predicted O-methyltransferase YrrM
VKKLLTEYLLRILPNLYFSEFLSSFLLKHIRPTNYIDLWSTQPFNGQIQRAAQIRTLAHEFKPSICIETGTYFGTSTPHLASLVSGNTYTIEIDPKIYSDAKKRLGKNFPMLEIDCILGDSATQLNQLLQKLDPSSEKIFAYLDAHWLYALPLARELEILTQWGGEWIAIVDDFMVPGDTGYGFDEYGSEVIGKSQVPVNLDLKIFVPKGLSHLETGARRGTGYILSNDLYSKLGTKAFSELNEI